MSHNLDLVNKKYSEKELEEDSHLFNAEDWFAICYLQKLSEYFIEKYQDKVVWSLISIYQNLSEQFIEKHQDKISWFHISYRQKLSKKFIQKHINKLNIDSILENKYISDEIKTLKDII